MGSSEHIHKMSRRKRNIRGESNRERRRWQPPTSVAVAEIADLAVERHPDDDMRHQVRGLQDLPLGTLPQLVLGRRFNRGVAGHPDANWLAFFEDFGTTNADQGAVFELGDIACVYANARSLEAMLAKRYSRLLHGRSAANDIQRGLSRDYREFVREQQQAASQAHFEQQTAPRLYTDGIVSIEGGFCSPGYGAVATATEIDDDPAPLAENFLWAPAAFDVRAIEIGVAPNTLSLDLSGDAVLQEEFQATRGFLKEEGLDVNMMQKPDGGDFIFEPRADFWQFADRLGMISMRWNTERPTTVTLHPPAGFQP